MGDDDRKPRVYYCWACGKKLWGNHHEEVVFPQDGHARIMHKKCAEEYRRENMRR